MYELMEIVAPMIMDKWEQLAYCMRYKIGQVNAFRRDSHDCKESCMKLFSNWLSTGHDCAPKTYQTLLNYIKKVKDFAAVSKEIEKELIKGTCTYMIKQIVYRNITFLVNFICSSVYTLM